MIEKAAFAGWPNCYRVTDGRMELIVTSDAGPRIVRLGLVGGENLFRLQQEQVDRMDENNRRIRGGHRFWHAPEARPRSYMPDNHPVQVEREGENTLVLIPPTEPTTGMQKTIGITLAGDHMEVAHTLTNHGIWPVEAAPWGISVMKIHSVAIFPQPQGDPAGLLPNRTVALWPYTDMSDPRVQWGRRFIVIRQDPAVQRRIKVGLSARDGWAACLVGATLFLKGLDYFADAVYPDLGCTVESFVAGAILEFETLGPLVYLEPGDSTTHVERWYLFEDVRCDVSDEEDIEGALRPLVGQAG